MPRSFNLEQFEKAKRKRTRLSALLIFILIPLTIMFGYYFLGDRKYILISILILVYTMFPFFMVFEKRKPKAREIVMIGMLSALTVCGNLLSVGVLPIQMGTAMVIISGISFGPEAGFLVGALARFISNFFQGQGPWTPWQMFCWGLLGFLAGLVFNKVDLDKIKSRDFKVIMGPVICVIFSMIIAYISYLLFPGKDNTFFGWRLYIFGVAGLIAGVSLQHKRLPVDDLTLTVFTFFTVFILYGGIMNICAMVTSAALPGKEISLDAMKLLYISGAPYDAVHAARAAICMFILGDKMIRKLERVKIKYGFYR